jgi:hypothetical protein
MSDKGQAHRYAKRIYGTVLNYANAQHGTKGALVVKHPRGGYAVDVFMSTPDPIEPGALQGGLARLIV